jgi:alkylhydroperoxidase family enzyme
MIEIKHTPGPWEAIGRTVSAENGSVFCIADCNAAITGRGWSGTDYTGEQYQLANARLIAAAPELLAAAQIGLQYIEAVCFNTPNPKKRANYADAASIIRAAITKATGSQS